MKIVITENKLEKVLKQSGTKKTIELLGGWDNFCKVFKIESPMDFLHLFDDLEQVQSEKQENWTLFCYKKGENLMIYDRKNKEVYINNVEIWSFLSNKFDLTYPVIQGVTKKWLGEVYNLRGITTFSTSNKLSMSVG
jgi:hypothetical protein